MDYADSAGVVPLVEGEHGSSMGKHHVVVKLQCLAHFAGYAARREGALNEGVAGNCPDLVEGNPVGHLVVILLEAEARIFLEGIDGVAVHEPALAEQCKRRIKVMERDVRLDTVSSACAENVMVERDALGIHLSDALGKDAAPRNGDANAIDSKALAQRKVMLVVVIEIGSGICRESALLGEEGVPRDLALSMAMGLAFTLVSGRSSSENEALGKRWCKFHAYAPFAEGVIAVRCGCLSRRRPGHPRGRKGKG